MDVSGRANTLFARARKETGIDILRIAAENSAVGQLRSGLTLVQAVDAFRDRSAQALAQLLDEVVQQISHRGSVWKLAMADIGVALDAHFKLADETMDPALRLVGSVDGAAKRTFGARIAEVADGLREQLAEFDQGWSSPRPRTWPERHPLVYAIGLLVAGALIGELAKILVEQLSS